MDHSRALRASLAPVPRNWNRASGLWLRTVESDLAPLNIGLAAAYRRAQNRQAWSTLVGTATFDSGESHTMTMMMTIAVLEVTFI